MLKRRKFFYSVEFDGGISYIIAVSKSAAWRQAMRASKSNSYIYNRYSLKRISKSKYNEAHQ